MLKKLAAVVVLGHGLIHLMGFVVQFQLADIEGLSYTTQVLDGMVDVGAGGATALGILWLLAALAMMAAAAGLFFDAAWERKVLLGAVLLSIIVTLLGWPDSRFGVLVNFIILGALIVRKPAQVGVA